VIGLEEAADAHQRRRADPGAAGMTMTLAVCPPGQDRDCMRIGRPTRRSQCSKADFEVTWNDDGSERAVLELYDTGFVPAGRCAAPSATSATKKASCRC